MDLEGLVPDVKKFFTSAVLVTVGIGIAQTDVATAQESFQDLAPIANTAGQAMARKSIVTARNNFEKEAATKKP